MTSQHKNGGFISLIVTLVAVVLLLSAFKVNIRGYLDASPEEAQNSNVVLMIETGKIIWTDYIRDPFTTVWNGHVEPFFKGEFLSGLKNKVQEGSTLPEENVN
jgi:hypothetical protein